MILAFRFLNVAEVDRGFSRRPRRGNRLGRVPVGPLLAAVVVVGIVVLVVRFFSTLSKMEKAKEEVATALNDWMPDVFPRYGSRAKPFDKVSNVGFTNASFFGVPEQLTFEHWYIFSGGALKDKAGLVKGTYNPTTKDIEMTCTLQENRGVIKVKAKLPNFRETRVEVGGVLPKADAAPAATAPSTPGTSEARDAPKTVAGPAVPGVAGVPSATSALPGAVRSVAKEPTMAPASRSSPIELPAPDELRAEGDKHVGDKIEGTKKRSHVAKSTGQRPPEAKAATAQQRELEPGTKPKRLRTWRDSSGEFSIRAELVGYDSETGKVTLRKEDGSELSIDVDKLSETDQFFAKRVVKK